MGTEAAAMAKEAENANEIIHYFAQEWAPGVVIHMQTMYMTWITMAIVFLLFFIASRNPKLVPSGLQNGMEFFIDFLNGLMEETLGMKGRKYMAPFMITLFMFIFIGNELGMLPQIGVHWTSPTNDINTVFALSLMVAFGGYAVGVHQQGIASSAGRNEIVQSAACRDAMHELREFMFEYVYRNWLSSRTAIFTVVDPTSNPT